MTGAGDPVPDGELVAWPAIGREVRGGSWAQQAETTIDRIDAALREDRREDAAALVRHLVTEATEIHELLSAWTEEIPRILSEQGLGEESVTTIATTVERESGAVGVDFAAAWKAFEEAAETGAETILAGRGHPELVRATVRVWTDAHDVQLRLTAGWVDAVVSALGEEWLGTLWSRLQREGIEQYGRYALEHQPWERSFALLTQIALEGMHAHFGGPTRSGEIELIEHADRVELRFAPCGSGGQLVDAEAYGVTEERHPFAWNEVGVCHYCVHCCVLQQLEPIRRLGFPARVIDPPLAPGDSCSWSVYRDPSLVPDDAYLRVGERPPSRKESG